MLSLQNLIIVAPPPPDPNWHFNAQARKRVMQIKTQANSRGWTRSLVRGGGDFPSSNDIMHTIKVGWERAAFRRSKVFFLFEAEAEVLCIRGHQTPICV